MAARLVIKLISLRPTSGWTSWMQFVMIRCRMALLLLASLPPCNCDERQERELSNQLAVEEFACVAV